MTSSSRVRHALAWTAWTPKVLVSDTLRLEPENNTRIKFFDTCCARLPANTNWQLTANDSASGGLNKFHRGRHSRQPFLSLVLGAAPTNALYVDTTGRIGLRTSTPLLDVHLYTGDTPGLRLDQSSANGFTAQPGTSPATRREFRARHHRRFTPAFRIRTRRTDFEHRHQRRRATSVSAPVRARRRASTLPSTPCWMRRYPCCA